MKTDYFFYEGMRLRYLDSEGSGLPVLCFHGNSSAADSFVELLQTSGKQHRLIAVDFPGHGLSSHASEPDITYTLAGFADAVAATVRHFDFADYAVIGHSLGGHAVLEALPRLHAPQALVLVAAPPFNQQSIGATFLPDPSKGKVFQSDLGEVDMARLAMAFVNIDKLPPARFMQAAEMIRLTDPAVRERIGNSLEHGEFGDECQLLRDSAVPTLLLLGATDAFINRDYCANPDNFSGCRLRTHVFEDCSHKPHFEQPDRFAQIVDKFIHTTTRSQT